MNEYKTYRVICIYAAVLVGFKIFIYLWGIDRGIDIIDDGFSMLHYKFSEEYNVTIHSYFKILNVLLPDVFFKIVNLRLLAFVFYIICAVQLIISLVKTINNKIGFPKSYFCMIILVILSGILLTIQDRLLNYNVLNLFISSSLFLLMTLVITNRTVRYKIDLLLYLMIGVLLGLQFHIKFSSTVIFLLFISLITLRFRSGKLIVYLGTLLVSGIVSAATIIFIISESPSAWYFEFVENYKMTRLEGYGTYSHVFGSYVFPAIWYSVFILSGLLLFYILYEKGKHLIKDRYLRIVFSQVASIIILSVSIYMLTRFNRVDLLGRTGHSFIYYSVVVYPMIVLELYMLIKLDKIDKSFPKDWSLLLFMSLVFPFVVEVGGMSDLSVANYTDAVFWFFALALLLALIFIYNTAYVKVILFNVFLITTVSTVHFVHNYLMYPIRSLSSLWEQNVKLEGEDHIKVDATTANYINELNKKLTGFGFSDGDGLLFLYNEAGSVYLTSGFSPVIPLYLMFYSGESMDKILENYNNTILRNYHRDIKSSWAILDNNVSDMSDPEVLRLILEERVLCDSIYSPYSYGEEGGRMVYIYKPIEI